MKKKKSLHLYAVIGEMNHVPIRMKSYLKPDLKSFVGTKEGWNIELKDCTRIVCVMLEKEKQPEDVKKNTSGLKEYFSRVKTDWEDVKKHLLSQIVMFNCIVKIEYETDDIRQAELLDDMLFSVAKDVNGFLLYPDMSLYSGDKRLVFSDTGESDYDSFSPVIDTSFFLKMLMTDEEENKKRRERTFAQLEKEGISLMQPMPIDIDYRKLGLWTQEVVAGRVFAAFGVAMYAAALMSKDTDARREWWQAVDSKTGDWTVIDKLTPEEKEFVFNSPDDEELQLRFIWQLEGVAVLMWVLGLLDELPHASQRCDVELMYEIVCKMEDGDSGEFPDSRSRTEIMDAFDLLLHYFWACADAEENGREIPKSMDLFILQSQNQAFNWLTGRDDWGLMKY